MGRDRNDRLRFWTSDGTAAGTRETFPLPTAEDIDYVRQYRLDNTRLLVLDVDGAGPTLWQTDGTPENTFEVVLPTENTFSPSFDGSRRYRLDDGTEYLVTGFAAGSRQIYVRNANDPGNPFRLLEENLPADFRMSLSNVLAGQDGSRAYFMDNDTLKEISPTGGSRTVYAPRRFFNAPVRIIGSAGGIFYFSADYYESDEDDTPLRDAHLAYDPVSGEVELVRYRGSFLNAFDRAFDWNGGAFFHGSDGSNGTSLYRRGNTPTRLEFFQRLFPNNQGSDVDPAGRHDGWPGPVPGGWRSRDHQRDPARHPADQ